MPPNGIEEDIIRLLEKHPEGMKINDIANNLKTPRQTVSKYIYGLRIAGYIEYREVGRSKFCFLVKKPKGKFKLVLT
jgi:DNA-binding transcriptional ArsR family regulator